MSLTWAIKRLSSMDGREISYRIGKAIQARLEQMGFGLAGPAEPANRSAPTWVNHIAQDFDRSRYCIAADRIMQGRFDVFALEGAELGFPPNWNKDPKTGTQAPLTFGKLLDYRDERLVGDIKYLWEPNRHLELVTLAQAWHLSGDTRYCHACRILLDSWLDQCPYPRGPNWTSSLEHAVRLVNWSFAWHLLGGDQSVVFEGTGGRRFQSRWLRSIYQHCHFIHGHFSRYSSANNHLFGELTGLFIGALTWPLWESSNDWRDEAKRELEIEALKQVHADGVDREQATWYHHSVADMMLLAGLVGRANSIDFSGSYWTRLESMLEFIASIMDVNCNVPCFGDSDDGVMVRFSPSRDFQVYQSLLATGAVLFSRADFKAKARHFDDKSRWLLGDSAGESFESIRAESVTLPVHRAFTQGGYYILGDGFETPGEVRIVADAGPLGYLSIAAHGHADALSFTLSVGGNEILIDPGTFAYHTQKRWREYFRGTSAHNTLRVDGADQSVPGGNFLWTQHSQTRVLSFDTSSDKEHLSCKHDGYLRLSDPVDTQRELTYDRRLRTLYVSDSLLCKRPHRLEMYWHFSEECGVQIQSDLAIVNNGSAMLKLRWPGGLSPRIVRGSEASPIGGWISHRYDKRVPSNTLIVAGNIAGSWHGLTTMEIGFCSVPQSA
ncbi:MAG: alginate lyase family protein [Steroidobacteraceae bacterium]